MSRFKTIVPVPLGEIRRIEGKLGATAIAGLLMTATDKFAAGNSKHSQNEGATFTLNGAGNNKGLVILMETDDNPTGEITASRPADSWGRGHVVKAGEEVTVVLGATAAVVGGTTLLKTMAGGKVETGTAGDAAFSAIESAASGATGDDVRILARVL